ncbi:MAG: ParB/RepB/Spo0J family partition protein [Magnetococcales bacterium]|nr:ParB/RepB/Spo0J family partition protein [Magnetococcales bacterium]
MSNRVLGQGLGALLGARSVDAVERQRIRQVGLDAIQPNPWQPRQQGLDETDLVELADSIRVQGVLQPILVRPLPSDGTTVLHGEESYQLIAGERRWRAARLAGLTRIPVIVQEMDDRTVLEVALLENLQRQDLNPVDTARGYARLVQEFGYSHGQIAQRVGKSRMSVTNLLRLLHLPEAVLRQVTTGLLSAGHARALLSVAENPQSVTELAQQVADSALTVRETERLVQQLLQGDASPTQQNRLDRQNLLLQPEHSDPNHSDSSPPARPPSKGQRRRDASIVELEKRLASELQTSVTVTHTQGRGRIILEYRSLEALERLVNHMLKESQNDQ